MTDLVPGLRWQDYEYPSSSAPAELDAALGRLCEPSLTQEQREQLLYGEVLGLVLHQGDLYSGVVPLVEALGGVIEQREDSLELALTIVSFLEYVFARPIRDARYVLVRPYRYGACQSRGVGRPTRDALAAFGRIFGTLMGRLPGSERHADIYYRYVLCGPAELEAGLSLARTQTPIAVDAYASLVITTRLRAELFGGDAGQLRDLTPPAELDETLRVLLDAFRAPTRELDVELHELLALDIEVPWYWASGAVSVIGAVALMLNAMHRSEAEQIAVLERLFDTHAQLVRRHRDDEIELEFAAPEAMLEDVSTLVYLDQLGRGSPLAPKDMSTVQRRLFELVAEAKTHTHAMLYAGVLPRGMSVAEANAVGEIHRCYGPS